MNRVVLLDKCNGVSTGYMTILPENFQVRVGCYDDKKTVDILFLEKDEVIITVEAIYPDNGHAKLLARLGDTERIELYERMMHRICDDIASSIVDGHIEGCDEDFRPGVIPLEIVEPLWKYHLHALIEEIYAQ